MALTKETIDEICKAAEYGLADAVKALRYAWPIGLKEAVTFMRIHQGKGLRDALLDMANLKEGMVFENSFLRIEFKTADASFSEIRQFLIQALEAVYPNATYKEIQEFCMHLISRLKGRPSVGELQQLFENFSNHFHPPLRLEEIEPL